MELTLYQLPGCPFCAKVRNFLDEKNLQYTIVDLPYERSDARRQEIAAASGVETVPVLKADGTWIGDSDEIIAWLEKNAK